jgi:hypothetical protein
MHHTARFSVLPDLKTLVGIEAGLELLGPLALHPKSLRRAAGASPIILKTTFSNLVQKALLVRHGGGRSTWHGLPRLKNSRRFIRIAVLRYNQVL